MRESIKKKRAQDKLNALLGITEQIQEVEAKFSGKVYGVTEPEIQNFREIQGIIYFLQAPALFSFKTCPECGEPFAVSRKYVGYCSHECIRKSLNKQGLRWKKGDDLESLALDPQVWDGNEPIWIRSTALRRLQQILNDALENTNDTESVSESSTVPPSLPEVSTSLPILPVAEADSKPSSSPPAPSMTSGVISGVRRRKKRTSGKGGVSFGT